MKIWFDTEFIEDGRTIELLSIGMVREDGASYYAEPEETDRSRASSWVKANVLPHLTGPTMPRAWIRESIVKFCGDLPEFWAYYASYDWVALCQLFGTMMELPHGWPMYVLDLKQLAGKTRLIEQTSQEHNALADAIWTRDAHLVLESDALAEIERRVKEGREACAKVAAEFRDGNPFPTVYEAIAAAIRAQK